MKYCLRLIGLDWIEEKYIMRVVFGLMDVLGAAGLVLGFDELASMVLGNYLVEQWSGRMIGFALVVASIPVISGWNSRSSWIPAFNAAMATNQHRIARWIIENVEMQNSPGIRHAMLALIIPGSAMALAAMQANSAVEKFLVLAGILLAKMIRSALEIPYPAFAFTALSVLASLTSIYWKLGKGNSALKLSVAVLCIANLAERVFPGRELDSGELRIRERKECFRGGSVAVVEGNLNEFKYRILTLDHSVVGGIYIEPAEFYGESVYPVFYLQEAATLFFPSTSPAKDALLIGFGVGISAKGFISQRLEIDVIELHKEIFELSGNYFGIDTSTFRSVLFQDALFALENGAGPFPHDKYDIIVHDVFGGGSVPEKLFTSEFLEKVKKRLKLRGIAIVGFYGIMDEGFYNIHSKVTAIWSHVRVFHDDEDFEQGDGKSRNFLFICSKSELIIHYPSREQLIQLSETKRNYFANFEQYEVQLSAIKLNESSRAWQFKSAIAHWETMEDTFGKTFWTKLM